MGRFQYTSYTINGRVRQMRSLHLSYLFVALVASCFAAPLDCSAQVKLFAQVLATDECQLAPAAFDGPCVKRIVPIEGDLSLRRKGSVRRVVVSLDNSGSFSRKLEPGKYSIRLSRPRVGGRRLKRSAYRIAPATVTLSKRSIPGAQATHSALFVVAHRSRELGTPVGISDGLVKPKI
jgi:hypothetical protein